MSSTIILLFVNVSLLSMNASEHISSLEKDSLADNTRFSLYLAQSFPQTTNVSPDALNKMREVVTAVMERRDSAFSEKENLRKAEAELTTTYEQVESQLGKAGKEALVKAQQAWEKYRLLETLFFHENVNSKEEQLAAYDGNLVWLRVGHLKRMLTPQQLSATEEEFSVADDMLNGQYRNWREECRKWRPESIDGLKEVELSWIKYRDLAAESEAGVCSDSALAMAKVKTELTWERRAFLDYIDWQKIVFENAPNLEMELLFEQMRYGRQDVRQEAISVFENLGEAALPFLIDCLEKGRLRPEAVPIFAKLGASAAPQLLDLLRREKGFYLSDFLAATGPVIVPDLIDILHTQKISVCESAIQTLGKLGSGANDAIPVLIKIINEENHRLRELRPLTIRTVTRIDPENPEVAAVLLKAYPDCKQEEKRTFAAALGELGRNAKTALPEIIRSLRGIEVSYESKEALRSIISPEDVDLIPLLIEGLTDQYTLDWKPFSDALVKIGPPAVLQLKEVLNSQNALVVRRTVETLTRIGWSSEEAVPILTQLALNEDTRIAIFAIDALAKCGNAAKSAVPDLVILFKSQKGSISAAALAALSTIAPYTQEVKDYSLSPPFVLDPFYDAGFYDEPLVPEYGFRHVISADLNNDDFEDVAISCESSGFGTAGGDWTVYLRVLDRKFKRIGHFFAPVNVTLYKKERGVGYLTIYSRTGPLEGVLSLQKISMDGIEEVKSVKVIGEDIENGETLPIPEGSTKEHLGD